MKLAERILSMSESGLKGVGVVKQFLLVPSNKLDFKFVLDAKRPNIVLPSKIREMVIEGISKYKKKLVPPPKPVNFIFEMKNVDENDEYFGLANKQTVEDVIATLEKNNLFSK